MNEFLSKILTQLRKDSLAWWPTNFTQCVMILLLGPRQVGKTTFAKSLEFDMEINLATRQERLKYEKSPELLAKKVLNLSKKPLVYIDEIQNVPAFNGGNSSFNR